MAVSFVQFRMEGVLQFVRWLSVTSLTTWNLDASADLITFTVK